MISRVWLSLGLVAVVGSPLLAQGGPKPEVDRIEANAIGEAALRERLTAGFDVNENGELEAEECNLAVTAIRDRRALAARGIAPVLSETDVVQMFDADGNGQLSAGEFQSACRGLDAVLGEGASRRINEQAQGGRDGGGQGQGDRGGFQRGGGRPKGMGGRGGRMGGGGRGGRGR
jgi:hypothetical protein